MIQNRPSGAMPLGRFFILAKRKSTTPREQLKNLQSSWLRRSLTTVAPGDQEAYAINHGTRFLLVAALFTGIAIFISVR